MTIQYKLFFANSSTCTTVSDTATPHLQVELRQDAAGYYNPYYDDVLVEEIEVYYSGVSTDDFRLRGVTSDNGPPIVLAIKHEASGSFVTRADWSLAPTNPRQIDWVFLHPPTYGDWVIWTFNPSGGTPPVKVKVKLKRQDQLTDCP